MTYLPKRAVDLTQEKLFAASGLDARFTDLNPGAVIRTIFEAVSLGEEELDHMIYVGILEAIAEELYTAFDFTRLPSVPAAGVVEFFRDPLLTLPVVVIPVGTIVATPPTAREPEVQYETIEAVTIDAGQISVRAKIRAIPKGTIGNAPAGSVTLIRQEVLGVKAVTNPYSINSGRDEETDNARRLRFAQWVTNLRSHTLAGLEANARTVVLTNDAGDPIELVDRAHAQDSYVAGRVDVYIDNGGGDSSLALQEAVRAHLMGGYTPAGVPIVGYVATGIVVRVFGTMGVPVPVTGKLRIEPGFVFSAVREAVVEAVTAYLYGLGVFTEMIYADLLGIIVQVEGVRDVVLTVPTGNRMASFEERLLPGMLDFTEWLL